MLFKYTFINHEAKKLHDLIEYIVLDVWGNAQKKRFSLKKIEDDESREIVNRTYKYLKEPIHKIFKICSTFDDSQIAYVKKAFINNNNIEALCNNSIEPIFYDELELNTSKIFANKIKTFFNNLYKEVFKQKNFHLNAHYDEFFKLNKALCPFCGLTPLEKDSSNHRDDYDHYFSKEIYPFNAVNLKNLLPMCSDCNKKWKKQKNPIRDNSNITKSFYYFGNIEPNYEIIITILNKDVDNLDLEISFKSTSLQNEVDTWNRLFSLSKRYKENVLLNDFIGKGWLRNIEAKKSRDANYDIENDIYDAKEEPLTDKNFIKAPFLEACKSIGII